MEETSTLLALLMLGNGVITLIGWNAVLTSLDYFHMVFNYNVELQFPIYYISFYNLVGLAMPFISKHVSYTKRIIISCICLNITMVMMLLSSFSGQYWQSVGSVILLAVFNNVLQASFYSVINYYPSRLINLFNTGTGLSGLIIALLRIIAMLSIPGQNTPQGQRPMIILFFCFAIGVSTLILLANIYYFRTAGFERVKALTEAQGKDDDELEQSESLIVQLRQAMAASFPYNLLIFLNYTVTFMLFPGLSLRVGNFIVQKWGFVICVLMYNVGDTLGKYLAECRGGFNKQSIFYLLFVRCLFFYPTVLMVLAKSDCLDTNAFAFSLQLIIGLTNGFITSTCFILCSETVPQKLSGYSGMLNSLLLTCGIMTGSLLALALNGIQPPSD